MAGDTLKFLDYRKPKLEAGDYTFEVEQTYGDPDVAAIPLPAQTVNIKVQGDRIRINPDQVFAKYPPSGEKGNFNDTIPHISLKKPTLPWERSAYKFDNDSLYNKGKNNAEIHEPWFYLTLINEEDISRGDALAPKKVRITDLNKGAYVPEDFYLSLSSDIAFGTIGAEEEVQVIDLKKSFFKALIADRKEDLQYLAHVRQRESDTGDLKRELSVIMGNRFPQSNPTKYPSGMVNQALLVSLENYLDEDTKYTYCSYDSTKKELSIVGNTFTLELEPSTSLDDFTFTVTLDQETSTPLVDKDDVKKQLNIQLGKAGSRTTVRELKDCLQQEEYINSAETYNNLNSKISGKYLTHCSYNSARKELSIVGNTFTLELEPSTSLDDFTFTVTLDQETSTPLVDKDDEKKQLNIQLGKAGSRTTVRELKDCLQQEEYINYVKTNESLSKSLGEDVVPEDSYIRCIILTQWSFTSKMDKINFEERSKALDVDSLRLPKKYSDTLITGINTFIKAKDGTVPAQNYDVLLLKTAEPNASLQKQVTELKSVLVIKDAEDSYQLGFYRGGSYRQESLDDADLSEVINKKFLQFSTTQTAYNTLLAKVNACIQSLEGKVPSKTDYLTFLDVGEDVDIALEKEVTDLKSVLISKQADGTYKIGFCKKNNENAIYDSLLLNPNTSEHKKLLDAIDSQNKNLTSGSVLTYRTTVHPFIKNLPKRDGETPFDDKLAAGMSAILHQFRQGDRSLSWYRGPCVPSETTHDGTNQLSNYERGVENDGTYIPTDADRLLHYHKDQGMFDISYAAAYELGRFLAMKNEEYAKALYRYKKARSRYVFLQKEDEDRNQDVIERGITIENLPYSKLNEDDLIEDRELIKNYLEELALLKEIPHWYLIPDPHLLPQRTIRTFQIDFKWIQSLWLGALSLGGRTQVSAELYEDLVTQLTPNIPHAGFFLRSDLVWAYPEMLVNAKMISPNDPKSLDLGKLKETKKDTYTDYIDAQPSLTVLRQEELTPEILMVLTDQDLNYLSLALPPEALHYGSDVVEKADDNTDLFTTNKLYLAGKRFSVVWAKDDGDHKHHKDLEAINYNLEDGKDPQVKIEGSQLTINLGVAEKATKVGQLKTALLAHPNIQSVTTDSREEERLLDDSYLKTSVSYVIAGHEFTLIPATGQTLNPSNPTVSYTLQGGAIPTIAIDGSGKLELQLGNSETPTSLRTLKSVLEKQIEIQAVSTSSPDTAKLFEVFNSYTQSSQELRVAGKKFTLTMAEDQESAINNSPPTVTFDPPSGSTPELSLSDDGLIIQLGQKATPTSVGQLKTALVKDIEEIASVEITEDLNTLLLPEGYLKTEKEFVIAGRVFMLQSDKEQESLLDDIKTLNVSYVDDVSTPTVNINGDKLDITLGDKDSPTTVGQLKTKLLERFEIAAVNTIAADNEALILNAYIQNKLQIANKEFTLSYHTDLLDDHVPLVRDVLADGSQPKVNIQERKLIIDVGGKQRPTEIADLKTALEAKEEITGVEILIGANVDQINPYKAFTYNKAIKYAGTTVGNSLDISDLVNNQGIVAVSELATEIKNKLNNGAEVDQSYKDKMAESDFDFASAHLSRYLLEGEPKVEFSAGGTN